MTKFSNGLLVLLSVLIGAATLRVFPLGLEIAFPSMGHQLANAKAMFLAHIIASSIALVLGTFQILPSMRKRFLTAHRWVGRLYALTILVGGISGLAIAFQIERIDAAIGFALLAVLWLGVTGRGVILARARRIAEHRRWMICAFALTFAAVTLRLQLFVFTFGFDMPYPQVFPILAWSCWVPNILFALWLINRPKPIAA